MLRLLGLYARNPNTRSIVIGKKGIAAANRREGSIVYLVGTRAKRLQKSAKTKACTCANESGAL